MGDKNNVDTTSFRRAIWNYIHSLFGIRHDDYDYSVINKLLERTLKAYVKMVTCFPDRVMLADYDAFMRDFNHSEKVHSSLSFALSHFTLCCDIGESTRWLQPVCCVLRRKIHAFC